MPAASRIMPPQDYLRRCLDYNPETGTLIWKVRPVDHFVSEGAFRTWNARFAGKPTGGMTAGYRSVALKGVAFLVHRIIWKWMTGDDPPNIIDHRDRDPLNNRWDNLRLATYQENGGNCCSRSASGFKGVLAKRSGAFSAFCGGRYLGTYKTAEIAHSAYCDAAKIRFGEFWSPAHRDHSTERVT